MTDEIPAVRAMQGAAREMIRATRTLLDAMEEIVDDPDAIGVLVGGFGRVAREVLHVAEGMGAPHAASDVPDEHDGDDGIEHITVE